MYTAIFSLNQSEWKFSLHGTEYTICKGSELNEFDRVVLIAILRYCPWLEALELFSLKVVARES